MSTQEAGNQEPAAEKMTGHENSKAEEVDTTVVINKASSEESMKPESGIEAHSIGGGVFSPLPSIAGVSPEVIQISAEINKIAAVPDQVLNDEEDTSIPSVQRHDSIDTIADKLENSKPKDDNISSILTSVVPEGVHKDQNITQLEKEVDDQRHPGGSLEKESQENTIDVERETDTAAFGAEIKGIEDAEIKGIEEAEKSLEEISTRDMNDNELMVTEKVQDENEDSRKSEILEEETKESSFPKEELHAEIPVDSSIQAIESITPVNAEQNTTDKHTEVDLQSISTDDARTESINEIDTQGDVSQCSSKAAHATYDEADIIEKAQQTQQSDTNENSLIHGDSTSIKEEGLMEEEATQTVSNLEAEKEIKSNDIKEEDIHQSIDTENEEERDSHIPRIKDNDEIIEQGGALQESEENIKTEIETDESLVLDYSHGVLLGKTGKEKEEEKDNHQGCEDSGVNYLDNEVKKQEESITQDIEEADSKYQSENQDSESTVHAQNTPEEQATELDDRAAEEITEATLQDETKHEKETVEVGPQTVNSEQGTSIDTAEIDTEEPEDTYAECAITEGLPKSELEKEEQISRQEQGEVDSAYESKKQDYGSIPQDESLSNLEEKKPEENLELAAETKTEKYSIEAMSRTDENEHNEETRDIHSLVEVATAKSSTEDDSKQQQERSTEEESELKKSDEAEKIKEEDDSKCSTKVEGTEHVHDDSEMMQGVTKPEEIAVETKKEDAIEEAVKNDEDQELLLDSTNEDATNDWLVVTNTGKDIETIDINEVEKTSDAFQETRDSVKPDPNEGSEIGKEHERIIKEDDIEDVQTKEETSEQRQLEVERAEATEQVQDIPKFQETEKNLETEGIESENIPAEALSQYHQTAHETETVAIGIPSDKIKKEDAENENKELHFSGEEGTTQSCPDEVMREEHGRSIKDKPEVINTGENKIRNEDEVEDIHSNITEGTVDKIVDGDEEKTVKNENEVIKEDEEHLSKENAISERLTEYVSTGREADVEMKEEQIEQVSSSLVENIAQANENSEGVSSDVNHGFDQAPAKKEDQEPVEKSLIEDIKKEEDETSQLGPEESETGDDHKRDENESTVHAQCVEVEKIQDNPDVGEEIEAAESVEESVSFSDEAEHKKGPQDVDITSEKIITEEAVEDKVLHSVVKEETTKNILEDSIKEDHWTISERKSEIAENDETEETMMKEEDDARDQHQNMKTEIKAEESTAKETQKTVEGDEDAKEPEIGSEEYAITGDAQNAEEAANAEEDSESKIQTAFKASEEADVNTIKHEDLREEQTNTEKSQEIIEASEKEELFSSRDFDEKETSLPKETSLAAETVVESTQQDEHAKGIAIVTGADAEMSDYEHMKTESKDSRQEIGGENEKKNVGEEVITETHPKNEENEVTTTERELGVLEMHEGVEEKEGNKTIENSGQIEQTETSIHQVIPEEITEMITIEPNSKEAHESKCSHAMAGHEDSLHPIEKEQAAEKESEEDEITENKPEDKVGKEEETDANEKFEVPINASSVEKVSEYPEKSDQRLIEQPIEVDKETIDGSIHDKEQAENIETVTPEIDSEELQRSDSITRRELEDSFEKVEEKHEVDKEDHQDSLDEKLITQGHLKHELTHDLEADQAAANQEQSKSSSAVEEIDRSIHQNEHLESLETVTSEADSKQIEQDDIQQLTEIPRLTEPISGGIEQKDNVDSIERAIHGHCLDNEQTQTENEASKEKHYDPGSCIEDTPIENLLDNKGKVEDVETKSDKFLEATGDGNEFDQVERIVNEDAKPYQLSSSNEGTIAESHTEEKMKPEDAETKSDKTFEAIGDENESEQIVKKDEDENEAATHYHLSSSNEGTNVESHTEQKLKAEDVETKPENETKGDVNEIEQIVTENEDAKHYHLGPSDEVTVTDSHPEDKVKAEDVETESENPYKATNAESESKQIVKEEDDAKHYHLASSSEVALIESHSEDKLRTEEVEVKPDNLLEDTTDENEREQDVKIVNDDEDAKDYQSSSNQGQVIESHINDKVKEESVETKPDTIIKATDGNDSDQIVRDDEDAKHYQSHEGTMVESQTDDMLKIEDIESKSDELSEATGDVNESEQIVKEDEYEDAKQDHLSSSNEGTITESHTEDKVKVEDIEALSEKPFETTVDVNESEQAKKDEDTISKSLTDDMVKAEDIEVKPENCFETTGDVNEIEQIVKEHEDTKHYHLGSSNEDTIRESHTEGKLKAEDAEAKPVKLFEETGDVNETVQVERIVKDDEDTQHYHLGSSNEDASETYPADKVKAEDVQTKSDNLFEATSDEKESNQIVKEEVDTQQAHLGSTNEDTLIESHMEDKLNVETAEATKSGNFLEAMGDENECELVEKTVKDNEDSKLCHSSNEGTVIESHTNDNVKEEDVETKLDTFIEATTDTNDSDQIVKKDEDATHNHISSSNEGTIKERHTQDEVKPEDVETESEKLFEATRDVHESEQAEMIVKEDIDEHAKHYHPSSSNEGRIAESHTEDTLKAKDVEVKSEKLCETTGDVSEKEEEDIKQYHLGSSDEAKLIESHTEDNVKEEVVETKSRTLVEETGDGNDSEQIIKDDEDTKHYNLSSSTLIESTGDGNDSEQTAKEDEDAKHSPIGSSNEGTPIEMYPEDTVKQADAEIKSDKYFEATGDRDVSEQVEKVVEEDEDAKHYDINSCNEGTLTEIHPEDTVKALDIETKSNKFMEATGDDNESDQAEKNPQSAKGITQTVITETEEISRTTEEIDGSIKKEASNELVETFLESAVNTERISEGSKEKAKEDIEDAKGKHPVDDTEKIKETAIEESADGNANIKEQTNDKVTEHSQETLQQTDALDRSLGNAYQIEKEEEADSQLGSLKVDIITATGEEEAKKEEKSDVKNETEQAEQVQDVLKQDAEVGHPKDNLGSTEIIDKTTSQNESEESMEKGTSALDTMEAHGSYDVYTTTESEENTASIQIPEDEVSSLPNDTVEEPEINEIPKTLEGLEHGKLHIEKEQDKDYKCGNEGPPLHGLTNKIEIKNEQEEDQCISSDKSEATAVDAENLESEAVSKPSDQEATETVSQQESAAGDEVIVKTETTKSTEFPESTPSKASRESFAASTLHDEYVILESDHTKQEQTETTVGNKDEIAPHSNVEQVEIEPDNKEGKTKETEEEEQKSSLLTLLQTSSRSATPATEEKSTIGSDDLHGEKAHKSVDDDPAKAEEEHEERSHAAEDSGVPHKKHPHNLLSGVGSKVKHSLGKVKKAITGKSSHSKPKSPK